MLEPYRSPDYTVIIKLRRAEGKELILTKQKKKKKENNDNLTPRNQIHDNEFKCMVCGQ